MLVGYARTSTHDQVAGYEDQIEHLKRLGVEKLSRRRPSGSGLSLRHAWISSGTATR